MSDTPPTQPQDDLDPLVDRRSERRGRRWIAIGAAVVVVVVVVVLAITRPWSSTDQDAQGSPSGSAPAAAADATVRIGLTLEPTNLDIRSTSGIALDQVLIDNVYQGLVSREADGTVIPSLATAWTVSDDALTYTFTIATGATFSNGDPLTAAEAAQSIQQVIDKKYTGSEYLGSVASIKADDATSLVITLSKPYPDLLWALTGRAGLVLDPKATNDLTTSAIGSGPYLLDTWKQGDSITLTRNDGYWGATKPEFGTVVFRYIPDINAAFNAVSSGDLDILAPIDAKLSKNLTNADYTLVEGDASDKFVLAFNNKAKPLDDARVRQALRYAIDHAALVEARGGVDALLGGPIAPGDPGYEDLTSLFPYDPAQAKKLLAEAGYGDGLDLTLDIPNIYGTTLSDLLTSQFAAVGVTLKVESVEFATWLQDVYQNKDYQLSLVDHAESHDFANWANPDYYFNYDNADVQDLYAQSQVATTQEKSAELLAQAAKKTSEDAAADWLTNFRTVSAVRKDIQGFPAANINSRINVARLTVAN